MAPASSAEPPGLGHNRPPRDAGYGFRVLAWRKARAETFRVPPPEVLRRHVRRAGELGLPYRVYATIRATTGRDLAAFLVAGPVIGPGKLAALTGVRLIRLGLPGPGVDWGAWAPAPRPGTPLREARELVRAPLVAAGLPGDAVAMIGRGAEQARWAEAARLARFLAAQDYYGWEMPGAPSPAAGVSTARVT